MLYSIATVCLSGTLRQKIPAIAAAGFHCIKIFENDLILHDGSVRDAAALIADHRLKIVTYQPFRDFEGMPEPFRARTFDRAEAKFDLMGELGCDVLMVCSNVSPLALGGISRAADDFAELGARAAWRGMRVAYEALGWGRHVFDDRDSWEIVRRADHAAVGLTLDTFHIFSRGTDLGAIPQIPGDRIFLVQVADAPNLLMDHLSWSRHYRCFPGQGELPLRAFMTGPAATGYDGPLSLEIFNDQFRSGSVTATARDGYRSLVYLGSRAEDATHSVLPPPAPPQQVEFLEFALNDAGATDLANLLAAQGFTHAGRHPTKAVDLYAQGDIKLVFNRRPLSRASRPGVCVVGLTVPDATQTARRADVLEYRTEQSGTHGMRAIPDTALLTRVDHVAYTMSYEEMLSAVLLYRAVLGLEATTATVISDQGGLVKSQVMQTASQSVCIALNSSAAQGTVSNRVLAEYAGTGLHHIAFATTDIFAVAAALVAAGVATMPVPQNYYPDLAARFALPAETLALMQSHGILYDEDAHGRFFQRYTKAFRHRFAFESVQRQGYLGFGAPDAPVRTAKQRLELA